MKKTMTKMKSITFDQNKILSGIEKLSPQQGDILIFKVKTDEDGIPLVDLDTVQQTANMIVDILNNKNQGLFLMDKICLFSIENIEETIKRLENSILLIQEAADKVRNIENGNSEKSFVTINMMEDGHNGEL